MQKFFKRLPLVALGCVSVVLSCHGSDDDGAPTDANAGAAGASTAERFSFFVTSLRAMQELSGNPDGFGGDLRFGETGDGAGLRGADKICTTIAEKSMPGNAKTWRAFLSATQGEDGNPVHAIERVGDGPWYDRVGRLVAANRADLAQVRPVGADEAIVDDLPNEDGVPNHRPDPAAPEDDNHHTLTGCDAMGMLYTAEPRATCADWTSNSTKNSTSGDGVGRPRIGFCWSAQGRTNWISGQTEGGCGAGITGIGTENGGSDPSNPIVGSGGGYGAIYCFATMP